MKARSRTMIVLLGFWAAAPWGAEPPIDKSDLDVTFISQTPRYPALHGKVEYIDHNKPLLTKTEYEKTEQFFPREGGKVTFTAHFLNKGRPLDG